MLNTLIQEFSTENLNAFLRSKMSSYATENENLDYIFNDNLYEKYESVTKLGEASISKDDKLIVIASKTNEALTERTGKKNQYEIAKKVLREEFADASLFIFYDDKGSFRFSFVKANYFGTKRTFTEFKRYTYYVSKEQTNRTFIEQIEKCTFDSLENILEAFSVEKLNEAFFDEYKRQFVKFWTYLNTKEKYRVLFKANDTEKSIRDFTKKLLGRFVFLYFLQKKKWLGCSAQSSGWKDGKLDFLKKLYETYEKKDYFHSKCLTQLFFNTLNIKRENDLFAVEGLSNELNNTKIPYLNGGLFEEDREADAYKIDFPKEYFEELIAFFEQYNFTIDENSPDDHDIGIDPEMLGHIFENLLEDNKDKGAFYTPKEIVQYMTQESLIAYLKTHLGEHEEIENFIRKQDKGDKNDKQNFIYNNAQKIEELLDNVKVCDPAIGSGAFPMGILQEILRAKTTLDWTLDRTKAKKQIIQNSIYGVDLEAGAVDIARLRFWLSLVVEEDTPQALPNLDYKIMQGNSLISRYELDTPINDVFKELNAKAKRGGEFRNPIIERLIVENPMDLQKFKQLTNDYLNESDVEKKKEFRALINEIKNSFITEFGKKETEKISKARGLVSNLQFVDVFGKVKGTKTEIKKAKVKLKKLEEHKQDILNNATYKDAFEWRFEFPNLLDEDGNFEGFDVVIGNPPYIKEYENRNAFDGFRENSPYYKGKMDIWYGFACNGIDLLKNNGIECFIAQNNWVTSAGASIFRNKVLEETQIKLFTDFWDYKVFKSAGIQTMVYLLKKDNTKEKYSLKYSLLKNKKISKIELIDFLNFKKENNDISEKYTLDFNNTRYFNTLITFNNPIIDNILNLILRNEIEYLEDKEVAQGIVYPQDKLNKKNSNILGANFQENDGVFQLSETELNILNLSNIELNIVKPFYSTVELYKYYGNNKNKEWIIYTKSDIKNNINSYPNIKKHLDKFSKIITSDNKPYGLHRARKEDFFKGEKIISLRKNYQPCFTYTDFDCYVTQTFYSIKTSRFDLKYLTGLLNSKLIAFWLRYKGKMQGNNYQIDKEPLVNIPIKRAENEQLFVFIVDFILKIKEKEHNNQQQVCTSQPFEEIIDALVFELYFPKEFNKAGIEISKYAEQEFEDITDKTEEEQLAIIQATYQRITEKKNPLRNQIKLMKIELKELLNPILSV